MQRPLIIIQLAVTLVILPHSFSSAFKLPDTGQILCYDSYGSVIECGGTGQDGNYTINTPSYTDHGDGTVTDNITGLVWQKCSRGQNNDASCSGTAASYYWYEAAGIYNASYNSDSTYVCGELSLGGETDWRLPTIKELQSLIDFSIPYAFPFDPTINSTYFPNTQKSHYWSSTTDAEDPNHAWDAYFPNSFVVSNNMSNKYYVRCVRGSQASTNLTDNGDTVTDNNTSLVWQKSEHGQMTWSDALSYCRNLELPAGSGQIWRLPNIRELRSLVDTGRYNPAIDPAYFPGAHYETLSGYWSSTSNAGMPDYAWIIGFDYGGDNTLNKYWSNYVRCVRCGYGSNNPVRTVSPAVEYGWIQDAYEAASSPQTILALGTRLNEDLEFAGGKIITLLGGYDCDFSTTPGYTTVNSLTISGTDRVTISRVIIR
jgi:hypothetical protein